MEFPHLLVYAIPCFKRSNEFHRGKIHIRWVYHTHCVFLWRVESFIKFYPFSLGESLNAQVLNMRGIRQIFLGFHLPLVGLRMAVSLLGKLKRFA